MGETEPPPPVAEPKPFGLGLGPAYIGGRDTDPEVGTGDTDPSTDQISGHLSLGVSEKFSSR